MTTTIKHKFVSSKGDGTDATLVRPSNWNDTHDMQMATNAIVGRLSAGTGAIEELPVTSYMIGLLNTADYATLATLLALPTTGDAKLTYKTTADTGWVMANDGTIGNTGSGSTTANANTSALFTLFYNQFSDAVCPVQTSAGGATTRVAQGTAATAFTANCRLVIPKTLGRSLLVAGTGAGLTARALATTGGVETITLGTNDIPAHTHTWSGSLTSGALSGTASGSTSTTIGATNTTANDTGHVHNLTTSPASRGSYASGYNLDHTHSYTQTILNAGTGTSPNYFYSGAQSGTTGTSSLGVMDHLHYTDINADTAAAKGGAYGDGTHKHSFSGTFSGSCSISTWSSITVSGSVSGTTTTNTTTGNAISLMQPWTAWNIMIKL